MAGEIPVYIPIASREREFLYICRRHLLSISHARFEDQIQITLYTLVQRPPLMLYPFDMYEEAYRLVFVGDSQVPEDINDDAITDAVPISAIIPYEESQEGVNDYALTDAVPISAIIPYEENQEQYNNQIHVERRQRVEVEPHQLSVSERKKNWCIEKRPRECGIIDTYYYHLPTYFSCRSQVEVYKFIELVQYPNRPKRGVNDDQNINSGGRKRKRIYLPRKVVGYYNSTRETLCRIPAMPMENHPQESQNDDGRGNKRRRTEEDAAIQVGQISQGIELPDDICIPMYDFEF